MIYHFGPYVLDPRRRSLRRDDAHLDVGPKAIDLLIALVERAGEDVSREELLDQVWVDVYVSEGTLTQNISVLRKALDDSADAPRFIATVPRLGYRFVAPVSRRPRVRPETEPEPPPLLRRRATAVGGILVLALLVAVAFLLVRPAEAPERERIAGWTVSGTSEAHQLYRQGLYHLEGRVDYERAGELFRQAVELDPELAEAWAGLAAVSTFTDLESAAAGEELARRGLAADPRCAEAHSVLAFNLTIRQWRWAEAEKHFLRAIELDPDLSNAHHWYAFLLAARGRTGEALDEIRRAHSLDPLSPILATDLGHLLFLDRQWDEAIAQHHAALELDPDFAAAYWRLGEVYTAAGRYREAIVALERAREQLPRPVVPALAAAYFLAGEEDAAEAMLGNVELSDGERARVLVARGQLDAALAALQRACSQRGGILLVLEVEPAWDPLRENPRFEAVRRCMGLVP